MKILGLDLGDQWTGIAISDALGMFARPYQTVATSDLDETIAEIVEKERISTIVVGNPKTMKGTISQQTQKAIDKKEQLETSFQKISFILWDERLSSKRAELLKPSKSKEEKLQSHARAAAFILQSYLDYAQNQKIRN